MRPLQSIELFITMKYSKSLDNSICTLFIEISISTLDRLIRFVLNYLRDLIKAVEVVSLQATTI